MVDCIVQFEYTAEQEDELSMKAGDVIKNVTRHDGGWWEGELNGKKGMFPDNFVQVKKEDPTPKKATEDRKQSNVAQLQHKLGNTLEHLGAPMPVKTSKKGSNRKLVKVTFSYAPANDDELRLELGDIIEVTKQEDEGWWEGTINGKSGVFPSNFVELVKEDDEPEHIPNDEKPPAEPENDKESGPEIPGKKIKGIGLGNIFSGGPIKLRPAGSGSVRQPAQSQKAMEAHENKSKRSSTLPANSVPPERPPTLPPREQSKPVERAKVLYSYEAENEDEIGLEEGDIVVVLEKELEDAGWWKGELKGKVGVFPDNFVELLPEEKQKKPPPPTATSRPVSEIKTTLPEPVRPDKSPAISEVTKHHKHQHHKKQEEERPPPALPKKPGPPLHEKPRKTPPKITETTRDEIKAEPDKALKDTRASSFDNVDSQERLSHPTASRAKLPNRRPPSMRKETPGEIEEVQPSPLSPKSIRPHSTITTKKEATSVSSAEINHATALPAATVDKATANALHDLQRDLASLKQNTVSKTEYNKLKEDFEQLKKDFSMYKTTSNRRMNDLMTEVDDEKKKRNGIEIDVERIRKLAMS